MECLLSLRFDKPAAKTGNHNGMLFIVRIKHELAQEGYDALRSVDALFVYDNDRGSYEMIDNDRRQSSLVCDARLIRGDIHGSRIPSCA